ncbi:hypothetical protein PIROE2DRAFT_17080 [Piromyces sp. E2]|nr:hypothetical protein PIROE2DRAFT_17080 [Piromyces sp. E2]|eukprot:OUM57822.1 hypothetical protein PIROE2DRAFT_17080 [Piromyces sp. E2]
MGNPTKKQIEIGNKFIKSTLNSTEIQKLNKNVKYIKDVIDDSLDSKDKSAFSVEKCKRKCDHINNVITSLNRNPNEVFSIKLINNVYKKMNRPLIKENTVYMSCLSNCYIGNEISKEKPQNKENDSNESGNSRLNKRISCPSIVKVRDYKHEDLVVPVYENTHDDVRTRVDGCSSKVLNELADYFEPACNGHDACYHCLDKSKCDDDFYDNMQYICEKYFPGFSNLIDYAQCKLYKNAAYQVVKVSGDVQWGYDQDHKWNSNCKCTTEINNKLISKNFLIA